MIRKGESGKIEKLRRMMEAGELDKALALCKTVDPSRLRGNSELSVLAEVYYQNGYYDDALYYYEAIYVSSHSRRILSNMINLCLKLNYTEKAEEYLEEYKEVAPDDFYIYIYQYRIDKQRGRGIEVLIRDLEMLKDAEYLEEWAYELAKLYHKAGNSSACVAECGDIILWFGNGTYVDRARALRAINLSGTAQGEMTDRDVELVQEVRRLVEEGRTEEEVENFIEESTMEGGEGDYSAGEYRRDRFGQPVYEEEGQDVIWNTQEFGAISEELIRQQNTMDLLQGMQVAQQIRMHLDENRELEVDEENQTNLPINADYAAMFGEEVAEEMAESHPEQDDVTTEESADDRMEQDTAEIPEFTYAKEETEEETEETIQEEEKAPAPVKKSIWERYRERSEKKRLEKEAKEQEQREKIEAINQKEREAEEQLYQMLEEEEQEKSLSKSIKDLTAGDPDEGVTEFEDSTEGNTKQFKLDKESIEREPAEITESVSDSEEASKEEEAKVEENEEGSAKENAEGTAEKDEETSEEPGEEEAEAGLQLYEYPSEVAVKLSQNEAPVFFKKLKKKGVHAESFFSGFLVASGLRKQILRSMDQLCEPRNYNMTLMITGEKHCGKTSLAKKVAKCLNTLDVLKTPRVAVISGDKLNNMSLLDRKEQLDGATLIVENASALTAVKTEELLKAVSEFGGKTAFILEDDRTRMNNLLRTSSEMNSVFNNRIHMNRWSVDELFLYALSVLEESDYQMEEETAEIFLENIRSGMEKNREDSFGFICKYTEDVVARAERRMADELRSFALEGKYQEANLQLLKIEDLG